MIDAFMGFLTWLPVLALIGGASGIAVGGTMLGLFTGAAALFARWGGVALLVLFVFLLGYRAADERADNANKIATITRERNEALRQLTNEKAVSEIAAKERDSLRSKTTELDGKVSDYVAKLDEAEKRATAKKSCAPDVIDGSDVTWRRGLRRK